jgi:ABC-type Zn uptake system ZnuABC Zn-binding protein ZnuA
MATTNIVADVVANVGGDRVEVKSLLPLGADPHSFEPTPQDLAAVSQVDLVFANGLGLETFLDPLLANAGATGKQRSVSDGVALRTLGAGEGGEGEQAGEPDPHVWFDPNNVLIWVDNIEKALAAADPPNAATYRDNAERYRGQLRELDAWIEQQVARVPQERREIVTDHDELGYFARRYGFRIVGAVVPSLSTVAEPSAQEIAALEAAIGDLGAPAIFVDLAVNPSLATRIGQDVGVKMVFLYGGSLSAADGPAPDYIAFMRYDTSAIVDGLR